MGNQPGSGTGPAGEGDVSGTPGRTAADAATISEAVDETRSEGVPGLPFALQSGESVILFSRRHWVFLWPRLIAHALVAIIPVAVIAWLVNMATGLDGTAGKGFGIVAVIWLGYWAVRCFFDWYSYKNDIWVVTNQRIIDAIKPNLFSSRLSSADLVDVEDISVNHHGVLATAFRYGDLRCQTAGEQPNFILGGVPQPAHILAVIDAARDVARREVGRGWR